MMSWLSVTELLKQVGRYRMINSRCTCAVRVTVVIMCVCLLSHMSPLEHASICPENTPVYVSRQVEKFVGISLHSRVTELHALYASNST